MNKHPRRNIAALALMLLTCFPTPSLSEEHRGEQITVSIPEMHCPVCARTISSALNDLSSVDSSHYDFKLRTVTIHSNKKGAITDEVIINTISMLRYRTASIERADDSLSTQIN